MPAPGVHATARVHLMMCGMRTRQIVSYFVSVQRWKHIEPEIDRSDILTDNVSNGKQKQDDRFVRHALYTHRRTRWYLPTTWYGVVIHIIRLLVHSNHFSLLLCSFVLVVCVSVCAWLSCPPSFWLPSSTLLDYSTDIDIVATNRMQLTWIYVMRIIDTIKCQASSFYWHFIREFVMAYAIE